MTPARELDLFQQHMREHYIARRNKEARSAVHLHWMMAICIAINFGAFSMTLLNTAYGSHIGVTSFREISNMISIVVNGGLTVFNVRRLFFT
jgi:hypothetical protein